MKSYSKASLKRTCFHITVGTGPFSHIYISRLSLTEYIPSLRQVNQNKFGRFTVCARDLQITAFANSCGIARLEVEVTIRTMNLYMPTDQEKMCPSIFVLRVHQLFPGLQMGEVTGYILGNRQCAFASLAPCPDTIGHRRFKCSCGSILRFV